MSPSAADAIIVCFGVSEVLRQAVAALLADPAVGYVILVDNGRTFGQLEEIKYKFGGRVTLIGDGRNIGFGAGVNCGARHSRAPFLAIINPDCVVEPRAIGRLVETLNANCGSVAAGGLLQNPDGSEQEGGRRRAPSHLHAVARRLRLQRLPRIGRVLDFNQANLPLPDRPESVDCLSGAFMVMLNDAFTKVGGFDERFFLHFEDIDLCLRLRAGAGTLLFEPSARAVHLKGESSSSVPLFVTWHKHRSYVLFCWKQKEDVLSLIAFPIVAVMTTISFLGALTWRSGILVLRGLLRLVRSSASTASRQAE